MNKTSAQQAYAEFVKLGLSMNRILKAIEKFEDPIWARARRPGADPHKIITEGDRLMELRAPRAVAMRQEFRKQLYENGAGVPHERLMAMRSNPYGSGNVLIGNSIDSHLIS